MKNVAVFCSGQSVNGIYKESAIEMGKLLGVNQYNLVWGAMNQGLMKLLADSAQHQGAKLIGITIPSLNEVARNDLDVRLEVQSVHARKEKFLEISDAFVTLVGGIGTLDEILEITELKKHRAHDKPIVIINTNHFYDALLAQMEKMDTEHFFPRPLHELLYVTDTPRGAIDYLRRHLTT